jgi:hypothetical protein
MKRDTSLYINACSVTFAPVAGGRFFCFKGFLTDVTVLDWFRRYGFLHEERENCRKV